MQKLKNNNGITLVALIITIIVLLILAGVSLSFVMNGGIFDKSQQAVNDYKKASDEENNELDKIDKYIEDKLNEIGDSIIVDADNVTLEGNVVVEGIDFSYGGKCTFSITTIEGDILPEATVISEDQYGKIKFSPISFEQEGIYKYEIRQEPGAISGVTFDNSVYTVVVEVRQQDEKLIAEVTYYDDEMNKHKKAEFTNKYSTSGTLANVGNISVLLEGRVWGEWLDTDVFKVVLKDNENSIIYSVDLTKDSHDDISFENMKFNKAGEYRYTISQVLPEGASGGNPVNGIVYDEKVYTMVVKAEDNGDGTLSLDKTYYDGNDVVDTIEFINRRV